jgi:hypothetical protein
MCPANEHGESWCPQRSSRRLFPKGTVFYFAVPLTADAVDGLMRAGRELAFAS